MGRTARERHRRRKRSLKDSAPNESEIFNCMENWMLSLNWFPLCELTPSNFPITGRGLKCLENIEVYDVLVKIPKELLITTASLLGSHALKIFQTKDNYEVQCVLAVFLVYEKHLGENSRWKPYLDSLPKSYTTPEFCSPAEKKKLSFIFRDLEKQFKKLQDNHNSILRSIDSLRKLNRHLCPHCDQSLYEIFTFSVFKWAYYTVNTRAVYIDSRKMFKEHMKLKDDDNMALAPFLDLFNHSYEAAVEVDIISDHDNRDYYQIKTLKSFAQGAQVFINYGSHDSQKLLTEYGFFIPNNPLDQISFDLSYIKMFSSVPQFSLDFIVSHNFDKNIGFISEGLTYNAKIVLFIVSTQSTIDRWRMKVYNGEFSSKDTWRINSLGKKILNIRMIELVDQLNSMKKNVGETLSFKIATGLVEEYINLLSRSLNQLNSMID